jgi:hypothetical protein
MASVQNLVDLHRLSADAMFERQPIQILHSDEGLITVLSDFINRADIGMVERGRSTSLAPKSFERLRVMSNVFGQELQGNEAPKFDVFSLVDNTHTTPPNFSTRR